MVNIGNDWDELLKEEFRSSSYEKLRQFLIREYQSTMVYPAKQDIFNALKATPYHSVRVVILGQDPYHGPGQAHGLCFSVPEGVAFPPSLQNIFAEIKSDLGIPVPRHGNLERWARQGVFLLNATLTVRATQAGSHQNKGWETFTDRVIHLLAEKKDNLVFMLWGSYAQQKGKFIEPSRHLLLTSVHPSPLSAYRGFFGNRHFSKANQYLSEHGKETIHW